MDIASLPRRQQDTDTGRQHIYIDSDNDHDNDNIYHHDNDKRHQDKQQLNSEMDSLGNTDAGVVYAKVTDEESSAIFVNSLNSATSFITLMQLIRSHRCQVVGRKKDDLIHALNQHVSNCSHLCLTTQAEAFSAAYVVPYLEADALTEKKKARGLRGAYKKRVRPDDELSPSRKPSTKAPSKRRKHLVPVPVPLAEWPEKLSDATKAEIIAEFISHTSAAAMKMVECSFCGYEAFEREAKQFSVDELNIGKLQTAVDYARVHYNQPLIYVFKPSTLIDNKYVVCKGCRGSITKKAFNELPLFSYANNCWIGEVPLVYANASWVEAQAMSRARCTQTFVKLMGGPTGQKASKGNVCVIPQEPGLLLSVLPPPIDVFRDEICIVFTSAHGKPVTAESLAKTPFLVRRGTIEEGIKWKISHDPSWKDVKIDHVALATYPEDGGIAVPVLKALSTCGTEAEGSSYTACTDQANDAYAEANSDCVPLQTAAMFDTEDLSDTYVRRKLAALAKLRNGEIPFVKYPSGDTPLNTRDPSTLAAIFPDLFCYGLGMPQSQYADAQYGFRKVQLRQYVQHLLSLSDKRFQLHPSFNFVMMNIMQRQVSSSQSFLATKKAWFPAVEKCLLKLDDSTLSGMQAKLDLDPRARPETEGEKAAFQILNYVNFISENISGSTAELKSFREEIRGIERENGTATFFTTWNLADASNPLAQIFAGRDIDLDKWFDELGPAESFERSRAVAANPVAGARFFAFMMDEVIGTILGFERPDKIGLLGKVHKYYGVVEAQGRGSLHLHLLVWIEGAPSPKSLRDKAQIDPIWAEKVLRYLEHTIKTDFPEGTSEIETPFDEMRNRPVMTRPLDPNSENYETNYGKDIKSVLELTGQLHTHRDTCYKHLPKAYRGIADGDKDCRFSLPRPLVEQSRFEEDGSITMKCTNGSMNGYPEVAVALLRCNLDIKHIGSGTLALALASYISNYISKIAMDSSVAFTILTTQIRKTWKTAGETEPGYEASAEDVSRLLLTRIANGMIGKRELSGQQVSAKLLGLPNHYTNCKFGKLIWTSILHLVDAELFPKIALSEPVLLPEYQNEIRQVNEEEVRERIENVGDLDDTGEVSILLVPTKKQKTTSEDTNEFHNMEEESEDEGAETTEKDEVTTPLENRASSYAQDYFYRPEELQGLCIYDYCANYLKESSKSRKKGCLLFKSGHPQHSTALLKKRAHRFTVMLLGTGIPRRDREETKEKYAAAMVTLFKPWSNNKDELLKKSTDSWSATLEAFLPNCPPSLLIIMDHMQETHECEDAKQDYAAQRKLRRGILDTQAEAEGIMLHDLSEDTFYQEAASNEDGDFVPFDDPNSAANIALRSQLHAAENATFYDVAEIGPSASTWEKFSSFVVEEDLDGGMADAASQAQKLLSAQITLFETSKLRKQAEAKDTSEAGKQRTADRIAADPFLSTLPKELAEMKEIIRKRHERDGTVWDGLEEWQRIAMVCIKKFTLNPEQTVAFLLVAESRGLGLTLKQPQFKLVITGPGGAGKSAIYSAIDAFNLAIGEDGTFVYSAPTGVAATQIKGGTTCALFNLRGKNTKKSAELLQERLAGYKLFVIDEISFLSASDMNKTSLQAKVARNLTHSAVQGLPFGGMDVILSGDMAQLPPPQGSALYSHNLTSALSKLNSLNQTAMADLAGVVAFRQVDKCVVLKTVMRQTEAKFIALLGRLRFGHCDEDDVNFLNQFVRKGPGNLVTPGLTDIEHWIDGDGCPIIVYCNSFVVEHNRRMTQVFGTAVGQDVYDYHSVDTKSAAKGKRGTRLPSASLRTAAWAAPPHKVDGLTGVLALVAGMPVFCVKNLATTLGISNGTPGTLISIQYTADESGIRTAVSCEVDFPSYNNKLAPDTPHRVLIPRCTGAGMFQLGGSASINGYNFTRSQLPIVAAFAYTSHKAQGRSLNKMTVDLESARSTASAYVMLSRVRTLAGLSILRPFSADKIRNRMSQEVRTEIERLDAVSEKTICAAKERMTWFYESQT